VILDPGGVRLGRWAGREVFGTPDLFDARGCRFRAGDGHVEADAAVWTQVVDPLRIRTSYGETAARLLETGTPSALNPDGGALPEGLAAAGCGAGRQHRRRTWPVDPCCRAGRTNLDCEGSQGAARGDDYSLAT
jgi:hypothetical protein